MWYASSLLWPIVTMANHQIDCMLLSPQNGPRGQDANFLLVPLRCKGCKLVGECGWWSNESGIYIVYTQVMDMHVDCCVPWREECKHNLCSRCNTQSLIP